MSMPLAAPAKPPVPTTRRRNVSETNVERWADRRRCAAVARPTSPTSTDTLDAHTVTRIGTTLSTPVMMSLVR
jgi:hypothetical protein